LIVPGFGVSLMTMNWAIYQSFARIPLGIAVTIEFLGPLTDPTVLLLGLAIGLLSSVIPVQLRAERVTPHPPRVFSILMSLERRRQQSPQ
jgi:threonine/homoserine efflux transporter RhtA